MLSLFGKQPLRLTLGLCTLLLTACEKPKQQQPASVATTTHTNPENIIIADQPASIPPANVGLKKTDFPVFLDGIPSLLHPIIPSMPTVSKTDALYSKGSDGLTTNYFSQIRPYFFQTNIYNIVFEDIETGDVHRLFPKDSFIVKSIFYPFVAITDKNTEQKTNNNEPNTPTDSPTEQAKQHKMLGHFLYEVKEQPDDNNSKTNIDEQLSLYMSDDKGKNLTKVHPSDQYLKSSHWLPDVERFYFVTQADTNKDNLIDDNDKYYNYVIEFRNKEKPIVIHYSFDKI